MKTIEGRELESKKAGGEIHETVDEFEEEDKF